MPISLQAIEILSDTKDAFLYAVQFSIILL